jgi:outer membrane protein OmpA-like peptidoglycan-associated protein
MVIYRRTRLSVPLAALTLILTACSSAGSDGPYMVYFPLRSPQLDAAAHDVVALAAERAKAAPAMRVSVVGYTDSAGRPPADVLLSQQRARAVAEALAADGVAPARIVRVGAGQTNENPGIASRRVEIKIGG